MSGIEGNEVLGEDVPETTGDIATIEGNKTSDEAVSETTGDNATTENVPTEVKFTNSIWPGVVGGIIVATAISGFIGRCSGKDNDSDSNTYNPNKLEVVTFSPEPGVECRGLSTAPDHVDVIASTIECIYLQVP